MYNTLLNVCCFTRPFARDLFASPFLDSAKVKELVLKCLQARDLAYCPYSRFPVGAAILTADGAIITGDTTAVPNRVT